MYNGSEPIANTSLLWIMGVPFKPVSYEISSLEGGVDDNDDNGGDWGEERATLQEDEDEEEEQDDKLDAKEGESLKVIKESWQKGGRRVFAHLPCGGHGRFHVARRRSRLHCAWHCAWMFYLLVYRLFSCDVSSFESRIHLTLSCVCRYSRLKTMFVN